MKIALCIMLDDDYLKLFETFAKSFLINNSWFDHDLIVMDVGLSGNGKEVVKDYFPAVSFRKPEKKNYKRCNFKRTSARLKNTFFTLDLFLYDDYDRIVFLDVDIIVDGDIKVLFDFDGAIGAVQCYASKQDRMTNTMNAGVFVVNKSLLTKDVYDGLMKVIRRGHSMPEQRALNIYFRGKIQWLPKKYNVEKRMLHSKFYRETYREAVIIHYVAQKPYEESDDELENSYGEVEKIWWDYYEKDFNPKCKVG